MAELQPQIAESLANLRNELDMLRLQAELQTKALAEIARHYDVDSDETGPDDIGMSPATFRALRAALNGGIYGS